MKKIEFYRERDLSYEIIIGDSEEYTTEKERCEYLTNYLERFKIDREKDLRFNEESFAKLNHELNRSFEMHSDDLDAIEKRIQNEIDFKEEVLNTKNDNLWSYIYDFQKDIGELFDGYHQPCLDGNEGENFVEKIVDLSDIEEKYFKLLLYKKELKSVYFLHEKKNYDSYKDPYCTKIEGILDAVKIELKVVEKKYNISKNNIENNIDVKVNKKKETILSTTVIPKTTSKKDVYKYIEGDYPRNYHNIKNRPYWDGDFDVLKEIFSYLKGFKYLRANFYKNDSQILNACFAHIQNKSNPLKSEDKIIWYGRAYKLARFVNWLSKENIDKDIWIPYKWINDHFIIENKVGNQFYINEESIRQDLISQTIPDIIKQDDKEHFLKIMSKKKST